MRACAAYPHVNLKVVGTHSGISIGEDGPSQMSIEEISLACSLAGFVVIAPADEASTKALVKAAAAYVGPVFIRTGRPKAPTIYTAGQTFEIGKSIQVVMARTSPSSPTACWWHSPSWRRRRWKPRACPCASSTCIP